MSSDPVCTGCVDGASVASAQGLYDKDLPPRQLRTRGFPAVGELPKGE